MGKSDRKCKEKISHRKKRKKEKKKHKERKYKKRRRKSSSRSVSETSTNSSTCGADEEINDLLKKKTDAVQDEIGWNNLFSERHTTSREKDKTKIERNILDNLGQSARELNPYWKDGGNGLPPTSKVVAAKSEQSFEIKSLKKLLHKAKKTADITGKSLVQIINKEGGPLENLMQMEVSQNQNMEDEGEKNIQPCTSLSKVREETATKGKDGRLHFMKPGESSHSEFMNTYKQNWRKKNEKQHITNEKIIDMSTTFKEAVEVAPGSKNKSVLTADALNALAAKKIKAEIMGDKALAERLEREIEDAKTDRRAHLAAMDSQPEHKEEVVLVMKGIQDKLKKPWDGDQKLGECSRKRQRGETHRENEKLRYFMDDDKHSLKSMFQSEKYGANEQSNELFLKLAKNMKFRSGYDDNDLDDDFLEGVRCSDYNRNEREKERNRAMSEARTRHKSLTDCLWCLDSNKVHKHLIISVGTKCYLCLPNDKSLTSGHCLIVPVHHDTCGTLLDEDVWNEMHSYRNRLCEMFESAGQVVVFYENARSFNRFPHMVLHCVPMDKEIGDMAPIYFKKAIMESETEWSNNKKLIDLKNKDLRRSVPKGLPYFTVDFGRDGGFAHVIEDEKLFPPNFAEEIIGGMLDLDVVNWRKRKKESLESQKRKVKEFLTRWKKYEDSQCKSRFKPDSDPSDSD